ncbi:MAG: hypothetical protein AB3X44_21705 [Leptothrix sp. (in: b-proteobacteria)]
MKGWICLLLASVWPCVFAAPPVAPSIPDCTNTYPQAHVSSTVEDANYKNCPGVLHGYSSFVGEQLALLRRLRPAYKRELVAKEDKADEQEAKNATKQKLDAFDQALGRIAVATTAPPQVNFAASSPSEAASKATGQTWLKDTRAVSSGSTTGLTMSLRP